MLDSVFILEVESGVGSLARLVSRDAPEFISDRWIIRVKVTTQTYGLVKTLSQGSYFPLPPGEGQGEGAKHRKKEKRSGGVVGCAR